MLALFGNLLWRKKKTRGQTVAEYALIVALVAIASIGVITAFGGQLRDLINVITQKVSGTNANGQQTDKSTPNQVDKSLNNL